MFSDVHVHHVLKAKVTGKSLLKEMDRQGMRRMAIMSPEMAQSLETQKQSIDLITKLCAEDPNRLVAFAWIEPSLPKAVLAVEYAAKMKVKGIKMIPNQWAAYEERLIPVFAKIEDLRKPILFHSGISWNTPDSSRFCRPANFEALYKFPKLKFCLAHVGWPWTDECIAVVQRMMALLNFKNPGKMQAYCDITPGTPPIYRKDVLHKAIEILGASRIIYGSDSHTTDLSYSGNGIVRDRKLIVDELKFNEADFEQIAWKTFDDFLKPMD